jgi:lincosamide nucleotidyltransferase A/C/D/E
MTSEDVAQALDRLDAEGVWYCIEGGWGVDALLEAQTRPHDDLDLGVRLDDLDRVSAASQTSTATTRTGPRPSHFTTPAAGASIAIRLASTSGATGRR